MSEDAAFSVDVAWAITGEIWTKGYRAGEALCLTTFQQCQLITLHDPEVHATLDEILKGWLKSGGKSVSRIAAVKRQLSQWSEKDTRSSSQEVISFERAVSVLLWLRESKRVNQLEPVYGVCAGTAALCDYL
jgi:hypothetical protein